MTHLFFDLDGTLLDSAEGITRAFASVMDHFSLPYTSPDDFRCVVGPPLYECFPLFSIPSGREKEALDVFQEYYARKGVYENALFAGVKEALVSLREAGAQLYVVTGKPECFANMILERLGIRSLFKEVVGADMEEKVVDKEILLNEIFRRTSLSPKEGMAIVGDRSYDILGGKRVGLFTVGVLWGIGSEEELRAAGADAILTSTKELLRLKEL